MRVLDPVMPMLAADFNRSMVEVALLSTWFTFFYAFGQPVLGPIGDTYGKARLMSYALMAVAANSLGMWIPTLLTRVYHMQLAQVGRLLGAMTLVGGLLGTVLGGSLAEMFHEDADHADAKPIQEDRDRQARQE